mgnify:FL=1
MTFEKDDPGTGSFKTKFALFMLLTSIIIVVLNLFSEYVYDINQLIRDNWPFNSDVYKSPLNPKVAPAVVANAIAIAFMWGRWTNKNLQLIIQRFQQEKYKSQGWIFFVAMLFFQPLQFYSQM